FRLNLDVVDDAAGADHLAAAAERRVEGAVQVVADEGEPVAMQVAVAGRDDLAVVGGAGVRVVRHGVGMATVRVAEVVGEDAAAAERRVEDAAREKLAVFESFDHRPIARRGLGGSWPATVAAEEPALPGGGHLPQPTRE